MLTASSKLVYLLSVDLVPPLDYLDSYLTCDQVTPLRFVTQQNPGQFLSVLKKFGVSFVADNDNEGMSGSQKGGRLAETMPAVPAASRMAMLT